VELSKRTSIERFFGRTLVYFHLQLPTAFAWSAVETRIALTYAAVWVIALAAWQAGRADLNSSPRLVLAHVWEGWSCEYTLKEGKLAAGEASANIISMHGKTSQG
jgi:hypothetical protein